VGEIFVDGIDEYVAGLLPERDETLSAIEEQAKLRNIPIVGPAVGRFFFQLAQMVGAETVFEMGSAVGYSTIWWARAVGETGKVIYTDGDRKNADEARGYFQRAGVADRIDVRTGDALELLSEEKGQFDIIFCDIDKDDYANHCLKFVDDPTGGPRLGRLVADGKSWESISNQGCVGERA